MLKADRARQRPARVAEVPTGVSYPITRPEAPVAGVSTPSATRSGAGSSATEAATDLRDLLEEAAARGFPSERLSAVRALLNGGTLNEAAIVKLEQAVRGWLARHRDSSGAARDEKGPM